MIAFIPLLTTIVLSAASPLTTLQCRNHSILTPQHCSNATNRYLHLSQRFNNLTNTLTSPTHDPQALSDTIAMFQPVLEVVCVGECLEPFVRCLRTVTKASKNATLFTTCARVEDGTFCLVKMWQEIKNIGHIVLNCSTFDSTHLLAAHLLIAVQDVSSHIVA